MSGQSSAFGFRIPLLGRTLFDLFLQRLACLGLGIDTVPLQALDLLPQPLGTF